MSDSYYHSVSSAKIFGGVSKDYYPLHRWMDRSKESFADFRHRALSHHAEGIADAITHFGPTITNSKGVKIPVRRLCEQHILEDLGVIPSLKDWYSQIKPDRWMSPEAKLLFREDNLDRRSGRSLKVL